MAHRLPVETSPDPQETQTAIRQALLSLNAQPAPGLVSEIERVLRGNLEHNRHTYFLEGEPDSSLEVYIRHVTANFLRLQPYLHQVQVEKAGEVWVELSQKMESWAYHFLVRQKNFTPGADTRRLARDYATDSLAAMARARFPYDTEFEPWAVVLVRNICLKRLREANRRPADSGKHFHPDDNWWENQVDQNSERHLHRTELRQDIRMALKHLVKERQRIIEMFYLDHLTPLEIARQLDMDINRVYALKFQGLRDLRKILQPNGYERF